MEPLDSSDWKIRPLLTWRTAAAALAAAALLGVSAARVELHVFAAHIWEFAQAAAGARDSSQIGDSVSRIASEMFPLALAEETPVDRIADFDPARLPAFARLEERAETASELNPETLQFETRQVDVTFLIEPFGYLLFVLGKMIETIEIALWATILAVIASLPLAYLSARNYTPHIAVYAAARILVGCMRAVPELISALFLVLAFGFGPVAGLLALALHSVGFLGKFYAEDIESASKEPQEALRAIGAGKLTTLRLAVLPQVLPNYTALTIYVLDRNVRMATVIGLVGAGGVGQELKGRFDLFQYDKVGTILLVIFATVLILDQLAAQIRKRLI